MAPFNLDACISQLLKKQLLHETVLKEICEKTKEVLMREGNVVHIEAPVTVVGDIHGQFYDLVEIFRIGGYAPSTNYLFLGDYVDRGLFSVETISLLTCLKLRHPNRIHLIRGNHESRAVTQTYGFYTECVRKYGSAAVWTYFTDMFDYLTLSVVIDDRIFCVHGGLSPSIHSIDQIKVVDRFREIPHEGPMADLVWSDPDAEKEDFAISPRGAGYTFGSQVVRKFLSINSMAHILRAHQLCMEGFSVLFDNKLSTVWSAPNYCYRCGNQASILEVRPGGHGQEIQEGDMFFNVFEAAPENDRDGPGQQASLNAGGKLDEWCAKCREQSKLDLAQGQGRPFAKSMGRHTNAASCSTSSNPASTSHRRAARPAVSLLAALALLDSIGSSPFAKASPVPPPFLDFLYPSFHSHPSPTNKPNRSPTGASRTPPARPGSTASDESSDETLQLSIDHNESNPQQTRIRKRELKPGIRVAVKYERQEEGWVEASSWNLHGRGPGADTPPLQEVPGLDTIQNLDALNPFEGSNIPTETLDLPVGWKQDRLNRHENYSPIIVTVFAVILVCSIVITIGLCRWRSKKLRRLRDLEQLERKAKYGEDPDESGSSQNDSDSPNEKTPSKNQKPRRVTSGKSSAIRRSLAARLRRKNKSRLPVEEPQHVDTDIPDATHAVPSEVPALASPDCERRSSARSQTDEPAVPPISSRSTSRSRPSSSRHSVSSRPDTQETPITPDDPNSNLALPPAYPTTRSATHVIQQEKRPIQGREDEYDPRDLTGYVRSPNPAIRMSASQTLQVVVQSEEDDTLETPQPPVPPFEGSGIAATSQVAAGATRQAHVATDDKRVLERMRSMAGAPTIHPSASNAVLIANQAEHTARAPTWDDLDEWHTEQQAEQHGTFPERQSASDLPARVGPSASTGLSLPPPPTLPSSPIMLTDVSELRLGHIWTAIDRERPSEMTASAPDVFPVLPVPSAPLLDDEHPVEAEASAPPAWDEEDDDQSVVGDSDDAGAAELESEAQSRAASTSETHAVIESPLSSESRPSTSRRSRFSATLDLPTVEGQCLPRYEP